MSASQKPQFLSQWSDILLKGSSRPTRTRWPSDILASTLHHIVVQILNWNGLENVWKSVRTICTTQFGDTSFNSFVKMLIAKNHQVESIHDSTLAQETEDPSDLWTSLLSTQMLDGKFCPSRLKGHACCMNGHWAPLINR